METTIAMTEETAALARQIIEVYINHKNWCERVLFNNNTQSNQNELIFIDTHP